MINRLVSRVRSIFSRFFSRRLPALDTQNSERYQVFDIPPDLDAETIQALDRDWQIAGAESPGT